MILHKVHYRQVKILSNFYLFSLNKNYYCVDVQVLLGWNLFIILVFKQYYHNNMMMKINTINIVCMKFWFYPCLYIYTCRLPTQYNL